MLALDSSYPCLIPTDDVELVSDFWRRALRLTVGRRDADQVDLVGDGGRVHLTVRRVMPPRPTVVIRLTAFDTAAIATAVERLRALGATPARAPYSSNPAHAVLVDPNGDDIVITAAVGPTAS